MSARWFTRKPPRDLHEVPIPPLKDDEWHCMTVLPYLVDHYYDDSAEDPNNVQYFTEHQLNGRKMFVLFVMYGLELQCMFAGFLIHIQFLESIFFWHHAVCTVVGNDL